MAKTGKRFQIDPEFRRVILSDPEIILSDRDVMQALTSANLPGLGENVVDIRGIALDRLETRLKRLEDTHRSVIAAAYENLSSSNQVHRAVLKLLGPDRFEAFLKVLSTDVADILRVDAIRLVLETSEGEADPTIARLAPVLVTREPGFAHRYTGAPQGTGERHIRVTLRQINSETDDLYGDQAAWIQSEACLTLDLGDGRLPGLLALGSEDPHQFKQGQGTDLLGFFGEAFQSCMHRWLA